MNYTQLINIYSSRYLQQLDLTFTNLNDPMVVALGRTFLDIATILTTSTNNIVFNCNVINALTFDNTRVNIHNLTGCPNLIRLNINFPIQLFNLDSLARLVSLEYLDITVCDSIKDNILLYLPMLINLTELNLSHTNVTNNILNILHNFPNLTYLNLSYTKICDSTSLGNNNNNPNVHRVPNFVLSNIHVPNLINLILDHNNINSSNLVKLPTIPTLKNLDISGCKYIKRAQYDSLLKSLPDVQIICFIVK